MKIFLTGATGFIGSRMAKHLAEKGMHVTALVPDPHKAIELDALGVRLVKGDIREKESMVEAMRGADQVFHSATWDDSGSTERSLIEAINIQGTRNVMELVKELSIPRCVYSSTITVYSNTHGQEVDESYRFTGKHISIDEETKWRALYEVVEPLAKAGLPVITVMPGLVYGPGDTSWVGKVLDSYLKHKLRFLPRGTVYNWSHIEDIVNGHILAMEKGKPGERYHLTGQRYDLLSVFKMAEQITSIPAPRMIVSGRVLKMMMPMMAVLGRLVSLPSRFTAERLLEVADVTYLADSSKARRELGFSTRPLEEGLKETLVYLEQCLSS